MNTNLVVVVGVLGTVVMGQTDDFNCPDLHIGFYPHLYSCDKYWYCQEGRSELRTCGNGLGFIDTDPTYTLEQCNELHLVECGDRTELEPPISTPHCPRAWGTFEDEQDCGVFWVCMDGKANRYQCPPGLAYDKESRGCRWADQVPECSNVVVIDEDGGEFQCPRESTPGIFTKHAHPADCRQYYLCIGGIPREYGCPLGTVFNVGSGNGVDGECSDPELVPECQDYYGDAQFDPRELSSNGFNSRNKYDDDVPERPRSSGSNRNSSRNRLQQKSPAAKRVEPAAREQLQSRPAPAALQEVVDRPSVGRSRPQAAPVSEPLQLEPARIQPSFTLRQEEPLRVEEPIQEPSQPILPARLTPIRIQPQPVTLPPSPQTERPSRLGLLPSRPNFRSPFRSSQTTSTTTTEAPTPRSRPFSRNNSAGRLSFSSNRFRPTAPPTTTPLPTTSTTQPPVRLGGSNGSVGGLPPPVKAAPGPNGEDYYYYYYYDEEEA